MVSLLHVAVLVFLRRGTGNFTVLSDEGRFEFFDLFVILNELTFDLGYGVHCWLGDILSVLLIEHGFGRFTIEWSSWDLGPTLHLRRQVSSLKLGKLILDLLLLLLCNRATHVVVVNILLSGVDHRISMLDTCRLRRLNWRNGTHRRAAIHVRVRTLATDSAS